MCSIRRVQILSAFVKGVGLVDTCNTKWTFNGAFGGKPGLGLRGTSSDAHQNHMFLANAN